MDIMYKQPKIINFNILHTNKQKINNKLKKLKNKSTIYVEDNILVIYKILNRLVLK